VGRVDEISFDPKVPGQIVVHLSVNPDTPITNSTFGTLGYQGVTGIAYVQLDDDGSNPAKKPSSKSHVARIEMRPSLLDNLQSKGLAILEQTQELTKRANALLAPENQKTMLSAFENVSTAATEIAAIPRQLQPTLAKLPGLTAEAQLSLASITKLSKDLQARGGAVDKFSTAADEVGSMADKIELEALPLVRDARSTFRVLNRTLENLNDRPQSILFGSGKLVPGPGEEGFSAPAR
jgi:phospholipid/cholesterol/gamma-HCH transport system substrate-binding protein